MVRLLLSFFIVLDLSIGTASFAQLRLSGKVVDESGSPVAFANVLAISSDSSFVAGDVTGEDGRYSIWLDKKKASFVRISFLGYDDILRPAGKKVLADTLKSSCRQIDEVTVSSVRQGVSMISGDIVVNVASMEALKNVGSMDRMLNKIPFVHGGGGSYSVIGTSGSAVVYINGVKMQDSQMLDALRSQDIATVEVSNTPGPRYKSSEGSIIRITTVKLPPSFSVRGTQLFQVQRRFSESTSASARWMGERTYLGLSASFGHTGSKADNEDSFCISADDADEERTQDVSEQETKVNPGSLRLTLNRVARNSANMGLSSGARILKSDANMFSDSVVHMVGDIRSSCVPAGEKFGSRPFKWSSSFYYDGKFGGLSFNATDELVVGRNKKTFEYFDPDNGASLSTNGKQIYLMNSFILTLENMVGKFKINYGAELTFSRNENESHKVEVDMSTPVSDSKTLNRQTLLAAFASIKCYPTDLLTLYAGLRYEHTNVDYEQNSESVDRIGGNPDVLCPTAKVSFNGDEVGVSLSYRRTVTRPSYSSLNNFVLLENQWLYRRGNPFLPDEKVDLGNVTFLYKDFNFTASYYRDRGAVSQVLMPYDGSSSVILKQTSSLPDYSSISAALVYQHEFDVNSPMAKLSVFKQWLSYDEKDYVKPCFKLSLDNYVTLPKDWWVDTYVSYSSSYDGKFCRNSDQWSWSLMVGKEIGGFSFDLSIDNLFLSDVSKSETVMRRVRSCEIEHQDFAGVQFVISYTFRNVSPKYSNSVSSSESSRF